MVSIIFIYKLFQFFGSVGVYEHWFNIVESNKDEYELAIKNNYPSPPQKSIEDYNLS